jgi:hypothetical protein
LSTREIAESLSEQAEETLKFLRDGLKDIENEKEKCDLRGILIATIEFYQEDWFFYDLLEPIRKSGIDVKPLLEDHDNISKKFHETLTEIGLKCKCSSSP